MENDNFLNRTISATGSFLHDKEIVVKPRTLDGKNGGHVITPFETTDGKMIMINRGWVPVDKIDPNTRPEGQIKDTHEVQGYLRKRSSKPSYFTPDNDPKNKMWIWMDVDNMAKELGTEPIMLELLASNKLSDRFSIPVAGASLLPLNNHHLNYALTWFSLSLALTAMSAVIIRRGSVFPKTFPTGKF